ncbi:MAG: hypothetical protein MJ238_03425 [Bacilli bacterium]|nr:hypothetical protein [Bacilli bacterium]
MKNKNFRPYLTRKNFIVIATVAMWAVLFVFTGLCLTAQKGGIIALANPILGIAKALGFQPLEIVSSAYVSAILAFVLIGVYAIVLAFLVIYIARFAVINKIDKKNYKLILSYVGAVAVCLLLSYGLSIIIMAIGGSTASVGPLSCALVWGIMISCALAVVIGVAVGAVTMFVINIKNFDKPYKLLPNDEGEALGEEAEEEEKSDDVSSSFDVTAEVGETNAASGGQVVAGGVAGDVTGENTDKARNLDEREKVFPGLCGIDAKYNGFEIESVETDDITLEDLAQKFRNWLAKEEHLYFDLDTIRIFLAGMGTSHFMILEGLSGTGKSSLPRYFAKFVNAEVTFIPVQATWRDKASVLGYFNDFARIYNETDFLLKLYEAGYNPDRIQMFVLDEMNISRVEYYFADFLSTLEYPEEFWKVRIMHLPFDFLPPTKLTDGIISIPNNSWFVGTANKDDSTFSIADKVYDRSVTIFFEDKNEPFEVKEETSTINLSNTKLKELFKEAQSNVANRLTKSDLDNFTTITSFIYEEFDVTYGNRILNQIETLVPTFIACGGTKNDALDFMLSRKVIVKLEGRFEEFVKPALKKLLDLLKKTYGAGTFKRSEHLINRLIKKL